MASKRGIPMGCKAASGLPDNWACGPIAERGANLVDDRLISIARPHQVADADKGRPMAALRALDFLRFSHPNTG